MAGRPAETGGGLAALATGIAAVAGASTTAVALAGVAAGLMPGTITWLVAHGGLRGACTALWRGR